MEDKFREKAICDNAAINMMIKDGLITRQQYDQYRKKARKLRQEWKEKLQYRHEIVMNEIKNKKEEK